MSIFLRLLTAIIIGAAASVLHQGYTTSGQFPSVAVDQASLAAFIVATCIAVWLSSLGGAASAGASKDSSETETGKVKWFNSSKGFGFITRQNGDDVFVHYRSIIGEGRRSLREGQQVEYIVTSGDKGPQAEQVKIIK
jgi:CspA family cold shock protein